MPRNNENHAIVVEKVILPILKTHCLSFAYVVNSISCLRSLNGCCSHGQAVEVVLFILACIPV